MRRSAKLPGPLMLVDNPSTTVILLRKLMALTICFPRSSCTTIQNDEENTCDSPFHRAAYVTMKMIMM
jgi:hypothetical protein